MPDLKQIKDLKIQLCRKCSQRCNLYGLSNFRNPTIKPSVNLMETSRSIFKELLHITDAVNLYSNLLFFYFRLTWRTLFLVVCPPSWRKCWQVVLISKYLVIFFPPVCDQIHFSWKKVELLRQMYWCKLKPRLTLETDGCYCLIRYMIELWFLLIVLSLSWLYGYVKKSRLKLFLRPGCSRYCFTTRPSAMKI